MIQSQFKVFVIALTLAAIIIGILLIEQATADEPLPTSPCVISGSGVAVTTAAGCLMLGNPDRDVRRDAGSDAGRDGGQDARDGDRDAQDGRRGPGKSGTRGGGKAKGKGGSQGHGDQGKGHE